MVTVNTILLESKFFYCNNLASSGWNGAKLVCSGFLTNLTISSSSQCNLKKKGAVCYMLQSLLIRQYCSATSQNDTGCGIADYLSLTKHVLHCRSCKLRLAKPVLHRISSDGWSRRVVVFRQARVLIILQLLVVPLPFIFIGVLVVIRLVCFLFSRLLSALGSFPTNDK